MSFGLALAVAAVAPGMFAPKASATVVVIHELDEMTTRADVVVHARVGETRVIKDEKGRIATLVEVEVLDGIKGAKAGDVLTIYQLGGTYEGERMMITGQHKWTEGEEMVFFAMRSDPYVVSYGIGVGKYHVERNPEGILVVEEYGDVVAFKRDPAGASTMSRPEVRAARSLDAFKGEIRHHVDNPVDLHAVAARRQLRKAPKPSIDALRKSAPQKVQGVK